MPISFDDAVAFDSPEYTFEGDLLSSTVPLDVAAETDIAFDVTLSSAGTIFLETAAETDTAFAVTVTISLVLLGTTNETDDAFAISVSTGIIDDSGPPGQQVTVYDGPHRVTVYA